MKKISEILLYLVLLSLPWQTRLILKAGEINSSPWDYGTLSLFGLDLLIVIAFVTHILANRLPIRFNNIVYRYGLIALLAYLFTCIPFSLSPEVSVLKLTTFVLSILVVYMLATTRVDFRKLALAFVIGAALSGLTGLWQFTSQTTFSSSWLGLAEHDPTELGVSVVEAVARDGVTERWLRAYGTLDHPNVFGGYMAIALIIAAWLWLLRGHVFKRAEGIALIFCVVVITAGLLVSFSRGAWIAGGIGVLILLIASLRKNASKKDLFAFLASIVIVSTLLVSQYPHLFALRTSGHGRLEYISSQERITGIRESQDVIMANQPIGAGAGTYGLALEENLRAGKPGWFYQPVHNVFLIMLAEIGVIGCVLFIGSLLAFLIYMYRGRQASPVLLFALTLALLVISIVDHWPYSLHFGLLLGGVLLGLCANHLKAEVLTESKTRYNVGS